MSCSPSVRNPETPLASLGQVVCSQGPLGWNRPGAGARLLSALCCFLKATLCPRNFSYSSFLWPILCISLVQIPEETCLTDLSSCSCPFWAGAWPQQFLISLLIGPSWIRACCSHPEVTISTFLFLLLIQELLQPKEVPLSVLYLG